VPGRQGGMPLDAIPQLILCLSRAADPAGRDRSQLSPQRPA